MTTIPETYRAVRRAAGTPSPENPLRLEFSTEKTFFEGGLRRNEVLIKIHAVSLNYRDVSMLHGNYPSPVTPQGILASDCGAEVVAVGDSVTKFKVGDHVSPTFDLGNLTGEIGPEGHIAVGGDVDGVLREYAIFEDKYLVHLPKHLSWEEASTLSCAGITAWNALNAPHSFHKNKTVLIQGTGGVSLQALLIALAGGITPIITSSSDEKLNSLREKLGRPDLLGFNYRTHPDQAAEVKRLTGGRGVDIVVNNAGPVSFLADIDSLVQSGGTISIVGYLGGFQADWNPGELFKLVAKHAKLQGVLVGSRDDFEAMNKLFEEKRVSLLPLVDDKVFDFDESQAAFDYLWSGKHVGKVVIRV